jgi:Ca-activated chloride channel family protein
MDATSLDLTVTVGVPAARAGAEPDNPAYALVRVRGKAEAAIRPRLDLCFVLDASASMHRFVLDPQQRVAWQQRAEARGEVSRQHADGRTGMVWSGQTLRELQQVVSTPMLSTLRGVWRTLEALQPADSSSVLAFADQAAVVYQDQGVQDNALRLETARAALGRLGGGVDESGLGRGTRLFPALQDAVHRLSAQAHSPALRRIVLVSDGIIEDREPCRALVEAAADRGIVISVIGVGDEFDEEFLMLVADLTRGNYYYAATAPEVEQAVKVELEQVTQAVGRQGVLRLFPANGTVIEDVYPVAPALSEFQVMWTEDGGWRFNIGDISAANALEFLARLAPAAHPEGDVLLAQARVEALRPTTHEPVAAVGNVQLRYTNDPALLQARDESVLETVDRLEIYLEERRAAGAAARGDSEGETRHLKAATRMLRKMGAEQLAADMDAAADEAATGTRNLSRTKRVKAGTRRLGTR